MGLKDGLKAGAVTAAVVGSGIAADVHQSGLVVADPVDRAATTSLAASHEALESAADAKRQADNIAEETDITWEQTTSLDDPPDWVSEPTELEAQITQDLTSSWELSDNGWADDSSDWSESADANSADAGADAGGAR